MNSNIKPFRFGVRVANAQSRSEWREKARKVEGLGYDTLNVPDHLADVIAPMPALVSAAEATKNLRVGTNVLNNDLRHPVLVAWEAAAVDLLTDGRLQLGLGAGSIRAEYEQAGLDFDRGAIRVERLSDEALPEGGRDFMKTVHYEMLRINSGSLPAMFAIERLYLTLRLVSFRQIDLVLPCRRHRLPPGFRAIRCR